MSECNYRPRLLSGEEMDELAGGSWDLFVQLLARNKAIRKAMAKEGYRWDENTRDWIKR